MRIIDAETLRGALDWRALVDELRERHRGGAFKIGDTLLGEGGKRMLVRSARVEGLGFGLKAVTVFSANPNRQPPLPSVQGGFLLFDDDTGAPSALVDATELTLWKTAADSALGTDFLARDDARTFLMIGAGAMAGPLVRAHCAVRPAIERVLVWNRTRERAEALAARLGDLGRRIEAVEAVEDLDGAVGEADIVSCATMASEPILRGELLRPGAHVDLVGAYTPDMREADDEAMRRGRLFVDCRETTMAHIGELSDPIARGVIGPQDVLADYRELVAGAPGRLADTDVTLCKNGGGAHLDLMVAAFALRRIGRSSPS